MVHGNEAKFRANYAFLLEEIDAEELGPHLVQEWAITLDDYERVRLPRMTRRDRAEALLSAILTSNRAAAYESFVAALRSSGHDHVADRMEDDVVDVPLAATPTYSEDTLDDDWKTIKHIQYNTSEKLGDGSEGTIVYRGRLDDSFEIREKVAVKRLLKEKHKLAQKEVDLLIRIDTHENVMRYIRTESDDYFLYIALELCESTLQEYIVGKYKPAKELSNVDILKQTAEGIRHLHGLRPRIVHRDVKPSNIMIKIKSNGRMYIKVADFGMSKMLEADRSTFTQTHGAAGTRGWMAPEVLESSGRNPSSSVDIFAMGCVFYYVLTKGGHPFGDGVHCQSNILHGNSNLDQLPDFMTKSLVTRMIRQEPRGRPSAVDVLRHPLLCNDDEKVKYLHIMRYLENKNIRSADDSDHSEYIKHRSVIGEYWLQEPESEIKKSETSSSLEQRLAQPSEGAVANPRVQHETESMLSGAILQVTEAMKDSHLVPVQISNIVVNVNVDKLDVKSLNVGKVETEKMDVNEVGIMATGSGNIAAHYHGRTDSQQSSNSSSHSSDSDETD